ncbi:alpha/beta hydrolase [Erwinia sp.]|uniref:UilS family quorum-quenching N-acyl-homoserine lactonase n=1 Tax=Erwinia citreus TaxID=558 RepID=UPI00289E11E3|nr:alpha/beta hydrolase [Erwinia sp.]
MTISTFKLAGDIAVTVRTPDVSSAPAIILCHGFCGIQDILLPAFAEAFTRAGFITLTFDYRGFGASGGERGRLVPAMQIDDIITVIDWASAQPDITRIGLWGTSLGGCHVMAAAARSPAVKCVVSQLAFADGDAVITGEMTPEEKNSFIATLDKMAAKKADTGKEMFVAITRVLNDEESKAFFDSQKTRFPAMDIKIPFLTIQETLHYRPEESARQVLCPTMVMVAGDDAVNPPQQGIALFDALAAPEKKLHIEAGAKHYDLYSGPHFDNIIGQQIDWYRLWL